MRFHLGGEAYAARLSLLVCVFLVSVTASVKAARVGVSFHFVEMSGRPGHEGLFPVKASPIVGEQQWIMATVRGSTESIAFTVVDGLGTEMFPIALNENDPDAAVNERVGIVTVPQGPFRIRASGTDLSGEPFASESELFEPSTLSIRFDELSVDTTQIGASSVVVEVRNYSTSTSATLYVEDGGAGLFSNGSYYQSAPFDVAAGETVDLTIPLTLPLIIPEPGFIRLTATVLSPDTTSTDTLLVDSAPARALVVDVLPRKCKKNLREKGSVKVAILSTDTVDATTLDLDSVLLLGSVAPLSVKVKDLGGPALRLSCTRPSRKKDGRPDLLLKFSAHAIAEVLGTGGGTQAVLDVTGVLAPSHRARGFEVIDRATAK